MNRYKVIKVDDNAPIKAQHFNYLFQLWVISTFFWPPFQPFIGKQSTKSSIIHRRVADRFNSSDRTAAIYWNLKPKMTNDSSIDLKSFEFIMKFKRNFKYFTSISAIYWKTINLFIDNSSSSCWSFQLIWQNCVHLLELKPKMTNNSLIHHEI